MSLSPSERMRHFDNYVESVETTLRDREVAAHLGPLAARILVVNAYAYLPNERAGQMHTPKEYRDVPDAVAIIPMSREEASQSGHLTQPIHGTYTDWRKMRSRLVSPVSGVEMDTDTVLRQLHGEPEDLKGLGENAIANTGASFQWGSDESGNYFQVSHPVVVADASKLDGLDAWNQAATIAHEEMHALDIINNPLLYKTPIGNLGSELAAYSVSDMLYNKTDQPAEPKAYTKAVEEWRQQHMPHTAPFAPSEEQLDSFRGWVTDNSSSSVPTPKTTPAYPLTSSD